MQIGKIKIPIVKDPNGKPLLNLPLMNNDDLFKEIAEADKKSKEKADLDDSDMEADLSGSDSEPSLDNFDNDELVKLLPTFVKKKSTFIYFKVFNLAKVNKSKKKISFSVTKSKQRVSIDANKDKISIITNIEVKINENKNNNSNEMNYITNLNIARPSSQKKNNNLLPCSNPSPPILNPPNSNTVLKFNNPPIINLKPLDGTGIFGRQKILHMNNKIIDKITKDVKRKDMETQTEEIFFKM